MAVQYTRDLMRDLIARHGYEVGDFTYGLPAVLAWGEGRKVSIGKYCSIADGVTIFLGGNHRLDWVTTYPFSAIVDTWPEATGIMGHPKSNGDVRIGNDVWLGSRSTIMSGISVSDGAVVAANAVVTKDVPPYAIVGGNPAKIIKHRFSECTIERLLQVKWWDLPDSHVRMLMPRLASDDVEAFLQASERIASLEEGRWKVCSRNSD
jgi:acetyltransferase-like isoleucine patch superfamily enzyme